MPSANVYNMDGEVLREESLDDYVFGAPVNTAVLHQVITAQLVNRRQGNADGHSQRDLYRLWHPPGQYPAQWHGDRWRKSGPRHLHLHHRRRRNAQRRQRAKRSGHLHAC